MTLEDLLYAIIYKNVTSSLVGKDTLKMIGLDAVGRQFEPYLSACCICTPGGA